MARCPNALVYPIRLVYVSPRRNLPTYCSALGRSCWREVQGWLQRSPEKPTNSRFTASLGVVGEHLGCLLSKLEMQSRLRLYVNPLQGHLHAELRVWDIGTNGAGVEMQ